MLCKMKLNVHISHYLLLLCAAVLPRLCIAGSLPSQQQGQLPRAPAILATLALKNRNNALYVTQDLQLTPWLEVPSTLVVDTGSSNTFALSPAPRDNGTDAAPLQLTALGVAPNRRPFSVTYGSGICNGYLLSGGWVTATSSHPPLPSVSSPSSCAARPFNFSVHMPLGIASRAESTIDFEGHGFEGILGLGFGGLAAEGQPTLTQALAAARATDTAPRDVAFRLQLSRRRDDPGSFLQFVELDASTVLSSDNSGSCVGEDTAAASAAALARLVSEPSLRVRVPRKQQGPQTYWEVHLLNATLDWETDGVALSANASLFEAGVRVVAGTTDGGSEGAPLLALVDSATSFIGMHQDMFKRFAWATIAAHPPGACGVFAGGVAVPDVGAGGNEAPPRSLGSGPQNYPRVLNADGDVSVLGPAVHAVLHGGGDADSVLGSLRGGVPAAARLQRLTLEDEERDADAPLPAAPLPFRGMPFLACDCTTTSFSRFPRLRLSLQGAPGAPQVPTFVDPSDYLEVIETPLAVTCLAAIRPLSYDGQYHSHAATGFSLPQQIILGTPWLRAHTALFRPGPLDGPLLQSEATDESDLPWIALLRSELPQPAAPWRRPLSATTSVGLLLLLVLIALVVTAEAALGHKGKCWRCGPESDTSASPSVASSEGAPPTPAAADPEGGAGAASRLQPSAAMTRPAQATLAPSFAPAFFTAGSSCTEEARLLHGRRNGCHAAHTPANRALGVRAGPPPSLQPLHPATPAAALPSPLFSPGSVLLPSSSSTALVSRWRRGRALVAALGSGTSRWARLQEMPSSGAATAADGDAARRGYTGAPLTAGTSAEPSAPTDPRPPHGSSEDAASASPSRQGTPSSLWNWF